MSTTPLTSSGLSNGSSSSSSSTSYGPGTRLTINGVSQYSNDLQTIFDRATGIAEIPVQRLQNAQEDAISKKTLLIGLNSYVDTLAQSVSKLGSLASGQALAATSSDSGITVVNSGMTATGTWKITGLTSVPTAASTMSTSSRATTNKTLLGADSQGRMTLVVGSKSYDFTAKNLNAAVAAINESGLPLSASLVSPANGANYLCLNATTTGATTIKLLDGPKPSGADNRANLLADQSIPGPGVSPGTNVSFFVNGLPVTNQASNVVSNVIPGLSFTLNKAPADGTATLSVTSDTSQISDALQSFVSAYNNLVDHVAMQVGPSAGVLAGDIAITTVQDDMRQLVSYQGAGPIKSLSDLGITMDSSGHMSFDSTVFDGLTPSQLSSACTFLGSSSSGLAQLANNFTQLSDPVNGLIRTEENGLDKTTTNLGNQIDALNSRIAIMQQTLQSKLQKADALLAQLESQQSMLTASLTSLNYVLYGKPTNQGR
jgi:flagellar hook-associated protein 2